MAKYNDRRGGYGSRRSPNVGRVLLLLVAVFVITGAITIILHKGNGGPKTNLASGTATTTRATGGKTQLSSGGETSTTANGTQGHGGGKSGTTTTAAKTHVTHPTTTTVPPPYVLFNVGGTGDDLIGPFVISTPATQWNVAWTYNCSKLGKKARFNYGILFRHGSRQNLNDLGPRQLGMSGAGVKHYYDAGTFNLSVATECSWTVKVSEIIP